LDGGSTHNIRTSEEEIKMEERVKEIKKVNESFKFPNEKVSVVFDDGTFSLRKIFNNSKGDRFFSHGYSKYQLGNKNFDGTYEYTFIAKRDVKGNINTPVMMTKDELKDIEDEKVETVEKLNYDHKAKHEKYTLIKELVSNDIPVYLHGPAGSGKNYTIKKIAKALHLDFYFTNSIQDYFKITGFIDGNGRFRETEFYKAFTQGGLFFLDELDASIPEVLVLLNAAIANRYFSFPNGQVDAHPDFRVIAAGNTVGSGSDEMYTGRSVIDISSIDRFAVVEFGYDKNIELSIAEGNIELVNFIHECRRIVKESGMRMVFSYRAIEMVTQMEKTSIDLKTILIISVFKGLDQDTINTFGNMWTAGKYSKALKEIQRA
jgi:hypothetical protein